MVSYIVFDALLGLLTNQHVTVVSEVMEQAVRLTDSHTNL